MDGGVSETGDQADKNAARAAAWRGIRKDLLGLIVPVGLLVFWFGGSTTRAWTIGFLWGLFGLPGEPHFAVSAPAPESATVINTKTPLRLLGHGCHREYDFEVCEGEVRNETDRRLEDVVAEIKFTDAHGSFVKAESAMVDYQPLMPRQTSPFTVMTTHNPAIWHYTIGFRKMFGGELKAAR